MLAQLMGLKTLSPRALHQAMQQGPVIVIDLNSARSWATHHVPGALHRDPAALAGSDPHPRRRAFRQPSVGAPPRAVHRGILPGPSPECTTKVLRTPARAIAPNAQSASSACSSGACDTPVGLRTKSIAVGMPASASTVETRA